MKAQLSAILLVLAPGLALAHDLTGGWTISSTSAPDLHCTLLQTGETLHALCAAPDGPTAPPSRGTVGEKRASWASDVSLDGRPTRLEFQADIDTEQRMRGVLTDADKTSPFTAVKDWAYDQGLR